jgi:hypothetical protein
MANLPFLGSILPSSLPEPISLPDDLLYLHLDMLPTETTDSLFNTLWSFLSPESDPLLLASLANADVIEFDIPSPSTIQIRAVWAESPHAEGWRLDIPAQSNVRIEVGIFGEGHGQDKDECSLGGLRAILGQDKDFEPTLFTFPHRHHVLHSKLETSLSPTYGSHPTLQTVLSTLALQAPMNDTYNHDTCSLHAMYTLSNQVFVDKYQLAQLAQFGSGGIQEVHGVWGETNLEDPSYHTPGWGSIVLVDIPDELETTLTLELPLHLRYLEPVDGGGKRHVDILPPEIFWACENTIEGIPLLS